MEKPDKAWWNRARKAQDRLLALLRDNPDVSLIDIGSDSLGVSRTLVLRVHLRGDDLLLLDLPHEIDGIPVRVLRGDYKPAS